jgi:hypothetical protein
MSYSGKVTGPGINCQNGSGTCINASLSGPVTLTAMASTGYAFDKWQGCTSTSVDSAGNGICVYSGGSSSALYVYFKTAPVQPPPPPALSVRIMATSGGVISVGSTYTTTPVSCYNNAGVCGESKFNQGDIVLQAQPDAGYVLDHFSGCTQSTVDTSLCTAKGGTDTLVDVYFKPAPPPTMSAINMVMWPGASGSLVAPDGSSCYFDGTNPSGTCSTNVVLGSYVTFTAQPSLGNVVSGWDGNCALNPDWTQCTMYVYPTTDHVGVAFKKNPCIPGQSFLYGSTCSFNWQDGNYIDNTISVTDWTGKTRDDCAQACVTTKGCVVASYCDSTVFAPYANTCVLRNAASAFYPSATNPQYSGISSWVNPAPLK